MTRVATLNARGGGHPTGRITRSHGVTLGDAAERISQATRAWNRTGVEIVVYNELSDDQADRLHNGHKRWRLHDATPVTTRPVAGRWRRVGERITVGNGIAWRRDLWRLDWTDEITVTGVGRKRPVLHFPVVKLTRRADHAQVVVVGVHFPPGRKVPARRAQQKCRRAVEDYLKPIVAADEAAVIIGGDTNNPGMFSWLQGFRLTVDHLRVIGGRLTAPRYHRWMRGRITDHQGAVSADLKL